MAIPAGATSVEYSVNQYGQDVEIAQTVKFVLEGANPASIDAAAQEAMEVFVSTLQGLSTVPVYRSRKYLCQAAGDTWPAP